MRVSTAVVAAGLFAAACAPTPTPEPSDRPDQCRAEAHRSLIGQNVAAVSFPADGKVRVVCTTCPTTRDYRPDRLNVRFDQASGVIRSVDCG